MPSYLLKIFILISSVWTLTLSLIVLIGLMFPTNLIVRLAIIVLILGALFFSFMFPNWYKGFLFRKLSKNKEDPGKNPYLQGNFAPIKKELSVSELVIEGKLPEELNGIYMRNGPNPAFKPISYTYPFDGDGMLHAVYIEKGKARYRNRFVETKGLKAEQKAGRALYGGVQKPIPPDPKLIGKNGDPGPIKNGAFIHIIKNGHQYLAMSEPSPAYQVDKALKTIGEWCPKGETRPFNINAHTRLDGQTGELFAFNYELTSPYLRYYRFNKKGELAANNTIDKNYASMIHDFILTENYLVFFDCPALFDLSALGSATPLLSWNAQNPTTIRLIHRQTNQQTCIETEPFFVYHFANGFEENNKLIIDYVRYQKLWLNEVKLGDLPHLYRATIDIINCRITQQQLDDLPVEFPRINERFLSQQNRYIYLPTSRDQWTFNRLVKYDLVKQQAEIHDFGPQAEIGEAVFIAKTKLPSQEDEGYLGLFVYDRSTKSSDFVLLEAQDFTSHPVASIKLPQRVPAGLHGSWFEG